MDIIWILIIHVKLIVVHFVMHVKFHGHVRNVKMVMNVTIMIYALRQNVQKDTIETRKLNYVIQNAHLHVRNVNNLIYAFLVKKILL